MTEEPQTMNIDTLSAAPLPGFADPVEDSQRVFRAVLDAMAHPGRVVTIADLGAAPAPLHKSTAAICQSLVDFETPLWVDGAIAESGQALNHIRFHCGCPVTTNPSEARTALVSDPNTLVSFDRFNIGTDERPDLSTTVIVQVAGLGENGDVRLTGPGIENTNRLTVEGVGEGFWSAVKANANYFPRGVDLILTAGDTIVCLPRTTKVEG